MTPTGSERGIGLLPLVYLVTLVVGLGVTLTSGYLLARAPFFGGAPPSATAMFASLAGFVAGIVLLAWAATRTIESGVGP